MNRQILFRGFHESDNGNTVIVVEGKEYRGKWVEGYLIGSDVIVGKIIEFTDEYFNTEWWYKVISQTVGQYRFDDCVGEKVFDNDIVADIFSNKGVVKYAEHSHRLCIHVFEGRRDLVESKRFGNEIFSWLFPQNHLTKIGNIYEKEYANA